MVAVGVVVGVVGSHTMTQADTSAQYYDNTILSSYKDCPRKYQLRHQFHWRSDRTAIPLVFGLSWHSAMDVVWQHAREVPQQELPRYAMAKFLETWEEQGMKAELSMEEIERLNPRIPGVAEEMLHGYLAARWGMIQEAELLASEQPFAVPVPGLVNVWYVGRLDKVINYQGQTLAIEHKTTTEYKKDGGFKTTYVEGWFSDSQVKGYQFGGALFIPGLTQVWVDASLVHKTVHDKFRLIPVQHSMPLLQEWLKDTQDWIGRLQRDQAAGYFPKNENACMGKFGPCPYLDVCRTTPTEMLPKDPPAGYMVEEWKPFETLGLDKLVQKEQQA